MKYEAHGLVREDFLLVDHLSTDFKISRKCRFRVFFPSMVQNDRAVGDAQNQSVLDSKACKWNEAQLGTITLYDTTEMTINHCSFFFFAISGHRLALGSRTSRTILRKRVVN